MKYTIAGTKTVELRRSNRYHLKAPVFYFWVPQNGPPQSAQGVTRDINSNGVYVQSDEKPPPGTLVQMDIRLPKFGDTGSGVHLTGEGFVLRVEARGATDVGDKCGGFAASIQFHPEASELVLSHLKVSGRVV